MHEISRPLFLGSSAEQDQPLERSGRGTLPYFAYYGNGWEQGERIDIFGVPCTPDTQLATAHAISETVTVLILQMRKQRLDNMPSVTQLVKQCLLSLLLDPGEGFHWPVLTHSPGS